MDDTIQKLVKVRRLALDGTDDGRRPWGLALSGGGIRSATFCLGLLKSLAARRQLLKFDLVSTVSGGGYIGATLGRLCGNAKSVDEVRDIERALGDVDRCALWLVAARQRPLPDSGRPARHAVRGRALPAQPARHPHRDRDRRQPDRHGAGRLQPAAVGLGVSRRRPRPHADRAPGGAVGDAAADLVVHRGRALPRVDRAGLRLLVGARPAVASPACWRRWRCGWRSRPAPAGSGRSWSTTTAARSGWRPPS